jgi:hypothetical protein
LHGSGLIGLWIFFIYMWMIFYGGYKNYATTLKLKTARLHFSLFIILILSIFIYLLSSRLYGFGLTFIAYLMIGALLRNFNQK